MTAEWIFDPPPPSGAKEKGSASQHALPFDLDVFVREVLQNSRDQRYGADTWDPSDDSLAQVRFRIQLLSGPERDRFLETIAWEQLEDHLNGAARNESPQARRLRRALEVLPDKPLCVLNITDSGTVGLIGGEDDDTGNFNRLCRNVLDTDESQSRRGGSYGLGKSVLWRFSTLGTVIFNSTVPVDGSERLRLFGRCELPYHTTASCESWRGPGWFGAPDSTSAGRRAVSVWDESARVMAERLCLIRPPELGTGTSIAVVGFEVDGHDVHEDPQAVARSILQSASRWFWPAMIGSQPSLGVSVEVIDSGQKIFEESAVVTDDVAPFSEAVLAAEVSDRATEAGHVAERELRLVVPARYGNSNQESHERTETSPRLRIYRSETNPELQNRVALVRGASMVVRYHEPGRRPPDGRPFHGVLMSGVYLKEAPSAVDIVAEEFLRAAEPPAHDEWTHRTERLKDDYKPGSQAQLKSLWSQIDEAILNICGEAPVTSDRGPQMLAKYFPVGSSGGGAQGQTFTTAKISAVLYGAAWRFAGTVRRQRETGKPWQIAVGVFLDAESGRGDRLPVVELQANGAHVSVDPLAPVVTLDAGIHEAHISGATASLDDTALLRRARLQLRFGASEVRT